MKTNAKLARQKRRRRWAEDVKQKLMEAAVKVVGEGGYSSSSIAKITSAAGVAHGTFYNYFESQQELFDELLPHLGRQLLEEIRGAIGDETDFWLREEIGFRTFFRFVQTYPQFYRILNEAETFAAKGYHEHMANMVSGYVRAVRRGVEDGSLRMLDENQIEAVVFVLIAARNYLCMRYALTGPLPPFVTGAYMDLVRHGLSGTGETRGRKMRRTVVVSAAPERELTWNFRDAGARGLERLFEAVLPEGYAAGDMPRAAELFTAFARQAVSAIADVPESEVDVINLAVTLAGASAKAFSSVTASLAETGEGVFSLHAVIESGEEGVAARATGLLRLRPPS